jgi:hypothetical protein
LVCPVDVFLFSGWFVQFMCFCFLVGLSSLCVFVFCLSTVGSGSAGSVVASRLSEDKDVSVLLIEAGDFDGDNPLITIPALGPLGFRTNLDWEYESEPQEGILTGMKRGVSISEIIITIMIIIIL